jgi:hypothetical protein
MNPMAISRASATFTSLKRSRKINTVNGKSKSGKEAVAIDGRIFEGFKIR